MNQELKLEDFNDGPYSCYCTVGQLLDFIERHGISREGRVFVERIEDKYFTEHGWETLKRANHDGMGDAEFRPAWSPAMSKEDGSEHLFLHLHY